MTTRRGSLRRLVLAGLVVAALPSLAEAQRLTMPVAVFGATTAAASAAQAAPRTGAATPSDRLVIEELRSGFVVAPEAKATNVNGKFANLAGVTAGWVAERTFLFGGGAYVLTNRASDFKMAYGGAVVGVMMGTERRVGFGVKALVGAGRATVAADTYPMGSGFRQMGRVSGSMPTFARFGMQNTPMPYGGYQSVNQPVMRRVAVDETFLVAEPEVNVLLKVSRRVRLDCGAGYRVVGGRRGVEDRLRGATGSLALQVGLGG